MDLQCIRGPLTFLRKYFLLEKYFIGYLVIFPILGKHFWKYFLPYNVRGAYKVYVVFQAVKANLRVYFILLKELIVSSWARFN